MRDGNFTETLSCVEDGITLKRERGPWGMETFVFDNKKRSSIALKPAHSPPSLTAGHTLDGWGGADAPAESTIWTIDCTTFEITGQWTNEDGCEQDVCSPTAGL